MFQTPSDVQSSTDEAIVKLPRVVDLQPSENGTLLPSETPDHRMHAMDGAQVCVIMYCILQYKSLYYRIYCIILGETCLKYVFTT